MREKRVKLETSCIDKNEYWKFVKYKTLGDFRSRAILCFHKDEFYDSVLKAEMKHHLLMEFGKFQVDVSRKYFETVLDNLMSEVPSSCSIRYLYNESSFVKNIERFRKRKRKRKKGNIAGRDR